MSLISRSARKSAKTGQNVCISVSMMEETQTNSFQSTSNSISKLCQRQKRFTTASVAGQILNNMELEFSWDGMSTSVKTSQINVEKGKSPVVPKKPDNCQSEVVSTQNLEQFPSPVESDYRNYKPAPKSKRKILLTPLKDKTSPQNTELSHLQPIKQLPESQKPTIEKCTEMQLQLLQGLDTMELQQKVYGIMHALYGLLLKNTFSSNCINKTAPSDGIIPATEVKTNVPSDETNKEIITSGMKKEILPAGEAKMNLPSHDNTTPLNDINKTTTFNKIKQGINANNMKQTPNNMYKTTPSKNIMNRTVIAKERKRSVPTTDLNISSTTESHDISGIFEFEEDDDEMSLIIDESAGTTKEKIEMSSNTETNVRELPNELIKGLIHDPNAPIQSAKDNNQIKSFKEKIDISKNVAPNEVLRTEADKLCFQPHLFTPESIVSIPVTKCIHLLPFTNDDPITINTLGESSLVKHKEKNKKAKTKLSHDKTIVPLHKFESFAQAKLKGNIKAALKQKIKRADKKISKSENIKPVISNKHTTKRENKTTSFIDSVYAELKCKPHLTSNRIENNKTESLTTKECVKCKHNKTDNAMGDKPHNAFRHTPISDTKIDSTVRNASIGENSLLVKKKRKVQVYRIPKCETAVVPHNEKKSNNEMTKTNLNTLPSEPNIPTSSNSQITDPSSQRFCTNSVTNISSPIAKKPIYKVLTLFSTVPAIADANTNNTQSLYSKPSTLSNKNTSTTCPVYPTNNLLNKFALQPIVKIRDCNMMDMVNIKTVLGKPKPAMMEKDKAITRNDLRLLPVKDDGSNAANVKRKHSPIIYDVTPDAKYATRHTRNSRGDLCGRMNNFYDDNLSAGQRSYYKYDANKYFTEKSHQGFMGNCTAPRRKRYQPYKTKFLLS